VIFKVILRVFRDLFPSVAWPSIRSAILDMGGLLSGDPERNLKPERRNMA
jgi:hypothetical protein